MGQDCAAACQCVVDECSALRENCDEVLILPQQSSPRFPVGSVTHCVVANIKAHVPELCGKAGEDKGCFFLVSNAKAAFASVQCMSDVCNHNIVRQADRQLMCRLTASRYSHMCDPHLMHSGKVHGRLEGSKPDTLDDTLSFSAHLIPGKPDQWASERGNFSLYWKAGHTSNSTTHHPACTPRISTSPHATRLLGRPKLTESTDCPESETR